VRNTLRRKVGRRLVTLSDEKKRRIIKRAKTLVCYGNNYRKYDTSEKEINDALFEFMRSFLIDFLLRIKKRGLMDVVTSNSPTFDEENPYWIYFVKPYAKAGPGGSLANAYKALTSSIVEQVGVSTIARDVALAIAITGVVALLGLEVGAAAVVTGLIYVVIVAGESIVNLSYQLLSN